MKIFEINTPFIAGALLTIFSGWLLYHALRGYKKSIESESWPSVEGKISIVELWGKRNVDGQIKEVEKLKIEYSFEVQGKTYKGSTAAFYTLMYPETEDFAVVHPVNSIVSVYYNTSNPEESVLIPGARSGGKRYSDILLACAGLVVSVSIAFLGATGKIG